MNAPQTMELLQRGMGSFQAGDLSGAETCFKRVLDSDPRQFEALHFLGVIEAKRGRFEEADRLISRSLKFNTQIPEAYLNHARVLNELKRPKDVVKACDRSLVLNSQNLEVLFHRGNALQQLEQYAEAVASYDKALAMRPDQAVIWANRGGALWKLDRYEEAVASFDRALAIMPNFPLAWANRAGALCRMNRFADALASYDRALAIEPGRYDALTGRGSILFTLERFGEALAAWDRALAFKADATLWTRRGKTLEQLTRVDDALASFRNAIALDPACVDALTAAGNLLAGQGHFLEAKGMYDRAAEVEPDSNLVLGLQINARLQICDWNGLDEKVARLLSIKTGALHSGAPFVLLALPSTHADQLAHTRSYSRAVLPSGIEPLAGAAPVRTGKLRIAYVSPDYRMHPSALSFVDVLERHDRSRFETIGISLGPDDGSEARTRVIRTFDQFHDVRMKSDPEVARLIRDLGVHIAVELAPHTTGHRPAILARRPAPVQVNQLSAWTSGTEYLDYVIGDSYALPFDQQPYYSEKIVQLPGSCFQRDCTQAISERTPERAEAGLPQDAFVFCSFNNAYKINPRMFDIWMRLLQKVEGSVLWLSQLNPEATRNVRRAADERGVDASRLIFAPRVPLMADHLARYRLADLFLDTLPYNAQTTTSDALWAGLPVVTSWGRTYVGRLAGSQLQAIGLGELTTGSLEAYEALTLELARDRDRLRALRQKLADNRATSLLFDSARLCRHFEAAYATMWDIYQRGDAPRSFAVDPIDARS